MTLSELRSFVRELLEEPSTDRFSEARINTAINRGYREDLPLRVNFYWQDGLTISLVAQQRYYDLPSPLLVPKELLYNDQLLPENSIGVLSSVDTRWYTKTGRPAFWYFAPPNKIGIFPLPDTSENNAIKISGWGVPPTLSLDTDQPALPSPFHVMLSYYASRELLLTDLAAPSAKAKIPNFTAIYQEYVENLKRYLSRHPIKFTYADGRGEIQFRFPYYWDKTRTGW